MCGEDFCEHFDFSQKVSGLLQDFRECVQDLLAQYGDIQIPIFYNRRWTSKAFKRFLTFPKKVSILQRMCATYIGPPETFKFQFWEEDKTVWRLFWLFPRKFRNFLASVKNVQINFLTGGGQHKSHVLKIIFLIIFTFPKKVLTVFFSGRGQHKSCKDCARQLFTNHTKGTTLGNITAITIIIINKIFMIIGFWITVMVITQIFEQWSHQK